MIRKTAVPVTIEQADIQAFEDSILATGDARWRRQNRVLFDKLPPPPPTYPAYAPDIHIDNDLNVWVRESSRPGQHESEWSVFSNTGVFLGMVAMPPVADVLDIGADYVVALQRDELGVEYVRKFRLRKDR